MSEVLPRVVSVKVAAAPRKTFMCIEGVKELARMAHLPQELPKGAIAHQFLTDFNRGALKPKPVLFAAKLSLTAKNR
jgi:hypothetical protein